MTRPLTQPLTRPLGHPLALARANGFTLIELMVALFVFGLLASAGMVLLRSSADGQAVLADRLGNNGRIVRASTLLRAELAQALPNGGRKAAFESGGGVLFAFTRAGQVGPDGGPPVRVAYRFEEGAFMRQVGQGDPAAVLPDLSAAAVEFRDDVGQWQTGWQPPQPGALPRAIRLTLTAKDGTVTHMTAAVGPQVRPVPTDPAQPAPSPDPAGGDA